MEALLKSAVEEVNFSQGESAAIVVVVVAQRRWTFGFRSDCESFD